MLIKLLNASFAVIVEECCKLPLLLRGQVCIPGTGHPVQALVYTQEQQATFSKLLSHSAETRIKTQRKL